MKYKYITYLFYSRSRDEFFAVNFGADSSTLRSQYLESSFVGKWHWMMEDSVLIDWFEEEAR